MTDRKQDELKKSDESHAVVFKQHLVILLCNFRRVPGSDPCRTHGRPSFSLAESETTG
jgi:hypothetical protein